MPVSDNTYSRMVAFLKVVLPILALAGLSTLFLVARVIDPAQNLPFADVDIEELARDHRISAPTFSGVTPSGAAFNLSAARAWPDPTEAGTLTGEDVRAQIDLPDGPTVRVEAGGAAIFNSEGAARLLDGVLLQTTDGYLMEAESLGMKFDDMRLWSDQPVAVTGPGLTLDAGRFELRGNGTKQSPYTLVFKGKVELLYEFEQ